MVGLWRTEAVKPEENGQAQRFPSGIHSVLSALCMAYVQLTFFYSTDPLCASTLRFALTFSWWLKYCNAKMGIVGYYL